MTERTATFCSQFHRAVELIGSRWTGTVINALMGGPARYAALRDGIPDISDRMLSERLRELEKEGIVKRHVSSEAPVRVEYELTDKGRSLEKALRAIAAWAAEWLPGPKSGKQRSA